MRTIYKINDKSLKVKFPISILATLFLFISLNSKAEIYVEFNIGHNNEEIFHIVSNNLEELNSELENYKKAAINLKTLKKLPDSFELITEGNQFKYNITDLLPNFVKENYGQVLPYNGPNCFRFTLMVANLSNVSLYISGETFQRLLENIKCIKRPTSESPQPGDIAIITHSPSNKAIHGYVYIGETCFSKNGLDNNRPYMIHSTKSINANYSPDISKTSQVQLETQEITYYDCSQVNSPFTGERKKTSLPPETESGRLFANIEMDINKVSSSDYLELYKLGKLEEEFKTFLTELSNHSNSNSNSNCYLNFIPKINQTIKDPTLAKSILKSFESQYNDALQAPLKKGKFIENMNFLYNNIKIIANPSFEKLNTDTQEKMKKNLYNLLIPIAQSYPFSEILSYNLSQYDRDINTYRQTIEYILSLFPRLRSKKSIIRLHEYEAIFTRLKNEAGRALALSPDASLKVDTISYTIQTLRKFYKLH